MITLKISIIFILQLDTGVYATWAALKLMSCLTPKHSTSVCHTNSIFKIPNLILIFGITMLNNKTVSLHKNAQEMFLLPLIPYLIKIEH